MTRFLHPVAGVTAFLTILAFWLATAIVECGGGAEAVLAVKRGILRGLLLLIPAMAVAGATGFRLGGASRNPGVAAKRKRMPVIALNGVLVLLPCAIFLHQRASAAQFDAAFAAVQGIELLAGAINLTLLGLNIRDGLRLSRRRAQAAG